MKMLHYHFAILPIHVLYMLIDLLSTILKHTNLQDYHQLHGYAAVDG